MKTVIVATNNENKLAEFRDILKTGEIRVISMKEAGVAVDPEENGNTIEENARIKARAVWDICHLPVLADDTGLFVDALDGEPGVHAARYAGDPQNSDRNIDKLGFRGINGLPDLSPLSAIWMRTEQSGSCTESVKAGLVLNGKVSVSDMSRCSVSTTDLRLLRWAEPRKTEEAIEQELLTNLGFTSKIYTESGEHYDDKRARNAAQFCQHHPGNVLHR